MYVFCMFMYRNSQFPLLTSSSTSAIDGSWRTAKAIYRWNPRLALHTLPVQITDTEASVFGEIKREPKEHFLSTMEAVAKALGGLLTGDENSILPVR